MEHVNIYDKISELFGIVDGNYSIMEEQIDVDLQLEYFEFSKNYKSQRTEDEIISNKDQLFVKKYTLEDKKQQLVELASVDNVEAFRAIEKYLKKPETDLLKNWATLAFQESRMLLESRLLDENQVFISTGLGGKNGKLRYFVVIASRDYADFNELQKKITYNEFEYYLKKTKAELEAMEFADYFLTLTSVVPLTVNLKSLFARIIKECNKFGNFLNEEYMITNVKKLSFSEIEDFFEENGM